VKKCKTKVIVLYLTKSEHEKLKYCFCVVFSVRTVTFLIYLFKA